MAYVRALMNAKLTRVRDVFREMDADGSGAVTEEEFRFGMRRVGVGGITSQDIGLLFKAVDTDQGGTVTYQELRDGLRDKGKASQALKFPAFQKACHVLGLEHLLGKTAVAAVIGTLVQPRFSTNAGQSLYRNHSTSR